VLGAEGGSWKDLAAGPATAFLARRINQGARWICAARERDPELLPRVFGGLLGHLDPEALNDAGVHLANAVLDQKASLPLWALRLARDTIKNRLGRRR
jgi:hypothetical protein